MFRFMEGRNNRGSIQRRRRFIERWLRRLKWLRGSQGSGEELDRGEIHDSLVLLMLSVRRRQLRKLDWRIVNDPTTVDKLWIRWGTLLGHPVNGVNHLRGDVEMFPSITLYHLPS